MPSMCLRGRFPVRHYLGVLTSISPCPLATNIAAISYIGRQVGHPRLVVRAGILYTLGRCLLYLVLAAVLTSTVIAVPAASRFLQKQMHMILGPIFLLLGMLLVGLITVTLGGTLMTAGMQKRIDALGVWGAFLLGILFALSFCPTSAAWFFGLLTLIVGSGSEAIHAALAQVGISVPDAALPGSGLLLPIVYGLGTALPVIVIAILLAYSAQAVGRAYHALSQVEWWARNLTGWVFIVLGVYFSLKYVFEVI